MKDAPALLVALGFFVGMVWREAEELLRKGWRYLFRLAEAKWRAHISRSGAAPVKEEQVDTKASVAGLLAGASGMAEALLDCGLGVDDTELLNSFIESMDTVRAQFMGTIESTMAKMREDGVPAEAMNDAHTACAGAMRSSPAFTSPWFLWRLSQVVRHMASRDVVEAARLVVFMSGDPEALQKAVGQLQAVLPKED